MAVTQANHTYVMTATNDRVNQPIKLASLRFTGNGLTVGGGLIVRESPLGSYLINHLIELTTEDVEFLVEERWAAGVFIELMPAGGGKLTVIGV